MFRKVVTALALALVLVLQLPAGAQANPQQKSEQRDGQSRYEVAPYSYLPLVLADQIRLRVAMMVIMMQSWTYSLMMQPGVESVSQNRVGLGGLFGSAFQKTYGAEDFLKSMEVGSIYRAGSDTIAVALKDDLRLEDYRVIVFNGDYQYNISDRPALRQIDRARLAELGAISLISAMLNHTLDAEGVKMVAGVETAADGSLVPAQLHDLPALRQLKIGTVYRGSNNTLLVVIPPAIVLDR